MSVGSKQQEKHSQCQEKQLREDQAESQLPGGAEENFDSPHHKRDPGIKPLLPCGQDRKLWTGQAPSTHHLDHKNNYSIQGYH